MKKIVKIALLFSLLASVVMVSCDKEEQQGYGGGTNGVLPIGDLDIHPLGDQVTVSFTSDTPWQIEKHNATWVEPSILYGDSGKANITFTVNPYIGNDTSSPREGLIKFEAPDGSVIDQFTITQKAAYIKIEIADNSNNNNIIAFGWQNELRKTITVESSMECQISLTNSSAFDMSNYVVDGDNYFGSLSRNETDFEVKTKAYNFGIEDFEGNIKVTPVRRKYDGTIDETLDKQLLASIDKTINISQDFLIFSAQGGTLEEAKAQWQKKAQSARSVELVGFDQLGYTYLAGINGDMQNATRNMVIVAEESAKYVVQTNDHYEFVVVKEESDDETIAGREVRFVEYEVRALKPNPQPEEKRDTTMLVLPLVNYETNEDVPGVICNFVQDAYIFHIEDGANNIITEENLFANAGDAKTYTLKTVGPWELPSHAGEWLKTSEDIAYVDGKATGTGDVTFTLTAENRNMSFTNDNEATLSFSTGNFNGDLTAPHGVQLMTRQPKFEFAIQLPSDADNNDKSLTLTSSNTNAERVAITSSGPWGLVVADDADWLAVNAPTVEGGGYGADGTREFNVQAKVNAGTISRSKTLKFISNLHKEAGWAEEDYTRVIEIIQDKPYYEILASQNDTESYQGAEMLAYSAEPNGLSSTFFLKCSVPWEIEAPDWLSFYDIEDTNHQTKISSGDGTHYLTLKMVASNNQALSSNSDVVTIKADVNCDGDFDDNEDKEMTFTVSQDAFVFDVRANSTYNYGALNENENSFTITISKDAEVTIGAIENWVGGKLSGPEEVNSKTDRYTYTLKPSYNFDDINGSAREATITIWNNNSPHSKSVKISQDAFKFKLDKTTLNAFTEVDYKGQSITVKECTDNYYDVILGENSWLTSNKSGNTWTFTPTGKNTATESRSGEIRFVVKDNSDIVLQKIAVSQNAYVWKVDGLSNDDLTIPTLGTTKTINISSSGAWEITCPSVDKAEPSSGKGKAGGSYEYSILTFAPNYTASPANKEVKVSNKDNANMTKTFTFKQEAYKLDVSLSSEDIANAGGTVTVTVTCTESGAWTYAIDESGKSWITANPIGNSLIITVASNKVDDKTKTNERTGTITISANKVSGLMKTITIKQAGFTPSSN